MAYKPFKMKGFKPHNMYKTEKANTHQEHLDLKEKGYDHNSPYKKDQLIKLSDQTVRVKPVKNLGNSVQSQAIKNEDKSTITNRYVDGKLTDSNYNPSKLKTKKIRKKSIRIPNKLKNVTPPEYNVKTKVSERDEMVYNYNKNKKQTVKDSKKKSKKVKNLVTGKTNKIS